jgi:hypothetical protein
MDCPPITLTGVTRAVYDCLLQRAKSLGLPVPGDTSGSVAYADAGAEFDWNEGAATLTVTITRKPGWVTCEMVESQLRQAARACGGD